MQRDGTPHRPMRGVCHLRWRAMKAMVWLVATTIGGALGWWVGAFVGIFTAVSLSAVGSGVALYYAQRLANEYLP